MEAEFNTSLKIYKQEKEKIISELNNFNGTIENKKSLLNMLETIDDKIEKYKGKLFTGKIRIINIIYIIYNLLIAEENVKKNNKSSKHNHKLKNAEDKVKNNINNTSNINEIKNKDYKKKLSNIDSNSDLNSCSNPDSNPESNADSNSNSDTTNKKEIKLNSGNKKKTKIIQIKIF